MYYTALVSICNIIWYSEVLKMYSVTIQSFLGELTILSTDAGVARVLTGALQAESIPGDPFGAGLQLAQYLAGERFRFDLPVDISGTAFQKKVWRAASEIAYGSTVTYRELAGMIGSPNAARAVGAALSRNPVPILIPCHRIVGSGGLTGYALGLDFKKKLLDLEKAHP